MGGGFLIDSRLREFRNLLGQRTRRIPWLSLRTTAIWKVNRWKNTGFIFWTLAQKKLWTFSWELITDFHMVGSNSSRFAGSVNDIENVGACWKMPGVGFELLPSSMITSPSYPCFWSRKSKIHTDTVFMIRPVFRETCTTVGWLTFCRLERHCGSFATVSAFYLKHLSLGQNKSPLLALY